jgi:hypothetical protein
MLWWLSIVAVIGAAQEAPKPDTRPCTCIAKRPISYAVTSPREPTTFERQTMSNLDRAHNLGFDKCLRDNDALEVTLELTFKANSHIPTRVHAIGPAPLVKCVEGSNWPFFGPPDRDTTVRVRIWNRAATEKAQRASARRR